MQTLKYPKKLIACRFPASGKVIQENEFYPEMVYFQYSNGPYGVWVNRSMVTDVPIKDYLKSEEGKRDKEEFYTILKEYRKRGKARMSGDDALNAQCNDLWGSTFTKSWQIRRSEEFHGSAKKAGVTTRKA